MNKQNLEYIRSVVEEVRAELQRAENIAEHVGDRDDGRDENDGVSLHEHYIDARRRERVARGAASVALVQLQLLQKSLYRLSCEWGKEKDE